MTTAVLLLLLPTAHDTFPPELHSFAVDRNLDRNEHLLSHRRELHEDAPRPMQIQ